METKLAENIRMFRKQRGLTQERLAEILNVTVGAVHKWEAKLSTPELSLIMEMADFFDTSVDVLLGYRMKDNSLDSTLERMGTYCKTLDPEALAEAEMALAKYPDSFRIVYPCAGVYLVFGISRQDRSLLRRALELLEQARVLLPQNTDPHISEAMICGDMSRALFLLDEREKCLELMKRNNAGGIFSDEIGVFLSVFMKRPEEAEPFLQEALVNGLSAVLSAVMGYAFLFRSRKDTDSALAITAWGIDVLTGLRAETKPDSLDKTYAEMLVLLSGMQAKAGLKDASRESLRKAGALARRFDTMPDYSLRSMRFGDSMDQTATFDLFGATVSEGVDRLLALLEDPELTQQWKEIMSHES